MPTYHKTRQSPATAANQLDYTFASRGFHESVKVRAMNSVDGWGASDHCRLLIEVADQQPALATHDGSREGLCSFPGT